MEGDSCDGYTRELKKPTGMTIHRVQSQETLAGPARESNAAAKATWNAIAVGSQRAEGAAAGSEEYFQRIRKYRYEYETPFIPAWIRDANLSERNVLEIGVGNGIDAVDIIRNGARYHGIDITRNHLVLTARNLEQNGVTGTLIQGDLTTLNEVPGAPFGAVYSFGVLHHIAHERQMLNRIREVLVPGGSLIISVYSKYSFFNAYLVATWFIRGRGYSLDAWRSYLAEKSPLDRPVTIRVRSRGEVQRLLESAGFRVIRYKKAGFVKRYLPVVGRFLSADGAVLNSLGALMGWYHLFTCERTD